MVERADHLRIAENDEHPAEPAHPRQPPAPLLRVEGEAGDDQEQRAQREHEEHRRLRHGIVANPKIGLLLEEQVVRDLAPEAAPPRAAPERHVENAPRVMVAHERPIDPDSKRDREDHPRALVNHPDPAEVEGVVGFAPDRRQRAADKVPRRREDDDREHRHPVPKPDRRLVDVHRLERTAQHPAGYRLDSHGDLLNAP